MNTEFLKIIFMRNLLSLSLSLCLPRFLDLSPSLLILFYHILDIRLL